MVDTIQFPGALAKRILPTAPAAERENKQDIKTAKSRNVKKQDLILIAL
jgi:hypothetical protein